MAYLEEVLPEFRKGAKIKRTSWDKNEFMYFRDGVVYDHTNRVMPKLYFSHFVFSDWELYQEPIDWQYIIDHKCLCWFWDDENDKNFIATLEAFEIDICVTSFKSKNGAVWHNCRPVRRDEVTFYEDKKDE